jgi:hypothetical protein
MSALTLLSFGYWGWGNAPAELVRSIDAAEAERGFAPPLFVDTRFSRSVRARGFDGASFERVVGTSRYRWMRALGNVAIRHGGPMRIEDPAAAGTLLDLALESARASRRLVFFCACERPGVEGQPGCCHRTLVAGLTLEAARRRDLPVDIVEWPGGEPTVRSVEIPLSRDDFDKVRRGAASVPIGDAMRLGQAAALPWYSAVAVRPVDEPQPPSWRWLAGPARYRQGRWCLAVLDHVDAGPVDARRAEIRRAREAGGYEPRRSADAATR